MKRKKKEKNEVTQIDAIMVTGFGKTMRRKYTAEAWEALEQYIKDTPALNRWRICRDINAEVRREYRRKYPKLYQAEMLRDYGVKISLKNIRDSARKKSGKKQKKS